VVGFRFIHLQMELAVSIYLIIETGKVLTVACAFSGEPAPRIEWSRGGKKLPGEEESSRFHIETTEDLTTLIITGVKESDAGTYTLKLSNEHGSDMATVTITVPLKFVKELQDIVLQEAESIGSSAVFECQISPSTAITTWMKDGSNIRESPKHKFTSDGKDRKLQIIDVQLSDTGEYTCVAKLGNKEKTSTAKLVVEGICDCYSQSVLSSHIKISYVEQGQRCGLEEEWTRDKGNSWQNSNQCYWATAYHHNPGRER
uniref:Ig-like domain-containing protein n=1 Tax=Sinocyclocheilus anshuiensis TaxID=1608454 RepID=A0A671KGA9_9TELE